MKTFSITAIVLCAALLAIVVFQRHTIHELQSQLARVDSQNARSDSAPAPSAQVDIFSKDEPESPVAAREANATPDTEILRLRGLAARTIRAEAELAQIQGVKMTTSAPLASPAHTDASSEPITAYLGEPISPPENLPEAYQREGLLSAVQAAAQGTGVTLKRIEIDTSEFPYLIGIVANSADDFEKLKTWLKQNGQYEYNGGTSSKDRYAFNITPRRFTPSESSQRVNARTILRENMLFDVLAK